ncbi:hypothetical protein V4841_11985 [Lelliottia amnigena]|uniref:Uncharacterized protein n=1 Tax=Lelliottia amnigena TaxID=61646 RepID=A0ABU7UCR0_LELAM
MELIDTYTFPANEIGNIENQEVCCFFVQFTGGKLYVLSSVLQEIYCKMHFKLMFQNVI